MGSKAARQAARGGASKDFMVLLRSRVRREHGREDAVRWLAERLRTSESYVSRLLASGAYRYKSTGEPHNMWRRLMDALTPEELEALDGQESARSVGSD